MEKENFLIYDDNVSLEAFKTLDGDCAIRMYYNNHREEYIIINFSQADLKLLIEHLSEFQINL